MVAAQASTLLLASPIVVIVGGALVWVAALALVAVNGRRFTRDRLAASS